MFRGVFPATRTPTREAASAGLSSSETACIDAGVSFSVPREPIDHPFEDSARNRSDGSPTQNRDRLETALDRSNGFVKHGRRKKM